MEKRISYYVSRKSFLVWLSALVLLAAAVLHIAYFCGKGADTKTVWLQIVLPVLACLLYVLNVLLDGQEHFYRTSVPVFLMAVYYGAKSAAYDISPRLCFVFWVAYLAIAAFYFMAVSGKLKSTIPTVLVLMAAIAVRIYSYREELVPFTAQALLRPLPDVLFLLGGLLGLMAAAPHLDGAYHPIWGDRPDGRKLRSLDPVQIVANYIMPNRNGASNFVRDSVEITNMERYIREKRRQGLTNFGITHVFLAAYVRVIAKFPEANRFLSGQQVYSRGDDIQFCMMVKEDMTLESAETAMKLHLSPTDTVEDVYRKFNAEVERIKNHAGASNFDKTAKLLSMVPGVVFKFVVWFLKTLDYFGLLPKFLLEVSPFHGTVFFTSMGSLGIPPIVHHLYDFGNLPVFCAFGCKRRENEVQDDGTVAQRKYIDYTFNTDERIMDGFGYATIFKYLKKLLAHPERLDSPPEEVNHDVD